jgi:hypothetical protein
MSTVPCSPAVCVLGRLWQAVQTHKSLCWTGLKEKEPHNATLLVKGINTGQVFFSSSLQKYQLREKKALYLWATWSDNNDQFDVGQLKVKGFFFFLKTLFISATGSAFAPA